MHVFTLQLEEKILEVTTSKDKEIKIRDEKLTRLKNQMADALKGNSWYAWVANYLTFLVNPNEDLIPNVLR